jgi:hypothetical protein
VPASTAPTKPLSKPPPRVVGDPLYGNGGFDFEQVEHVVTDEDPDTALCGVDQTDVPWNQGWPVCQTCLAISDGRLS